jgi:hypothetical protein
MSAEALEALLARVYTDGETRRRFLADPKGEARRAGVGDVECAARSDVDAKGLELAADGFAAKRARAARAREARQPRFHRVPGGVLPRFARWAATDGIFARLVRGR